MDVKNIGILLGLFFTLQGWGQETNLEWIYQDGGTDWEQSSGIAVDTDKNTYVVGHFDGNLEFGAGDDGVLFNSTGLRDIFIHKADADGEYLWAKQISGELLKNVGFVKVMADGNILISGRFDGDLDVDPGDGEYWLTSVEDEVQDAFLLVLDAEGNFVWAKRFKCLTDFYDTGGSFSCRLNSIEFDDSGAIYLAGMVSGIVNFGTDADPFEVESNGNGDFFIQKISSSGDLIWHKQIGGPGYETGQITLTDDGDVLGSGGFIGTVDFDPGPEVFELTYYDPEDLGVADGFILKLNNDGDFIWASSFGGADAEIPSSIVVIPTGEFYMAGYFNGTGSFGTGADEFEIPSEGYLDIFISKYTADGDIIWVKSIGGTFHDSPGYLIVDEGGSVYLTGIFSGTVDLDPGAPIVNHTAVGGEDHFIVKLNDDGGLLWSGQFETAEDFEGNLNIVVDDEEAIFGTSSFAGTVDSDPDIANAPLVSAGEADFFRFKLNTSETVRIDENHTNTLLTVYPNPAIDFITIDNEFESDKDYALTIRNLMGQIIYLSKNVGQEKFNIAVNDWSEGMYILSVYDADNQEAYSVKLIVK